MLGSKGRLWSSCDNNLNLKTQQKSKPKQKNIIVSYLLWFIVNWKWNN